MNDELERGTVRIVQSRALSYRVSNGSRRSQTNYVVELTAQVHGRDKILGYGESQPRWNLTGDDAGSSWKLLTEAVKRLEGRVLVVENAETALASVRELMMEMRRLASERSVEEDHTRPFRGTLLGIEAALLDLVARSNKLTLASFLGKSRSSVPYVHTVPAEPDGTWSEASQSDGTSETRFSIQLRGAEQRAQVGAVLTRILSLNQRDAKRTVWIDAGTSLREESARSLVTDIISAFHNQTEKQTVLLNEPFRSRGAEKLLALQRTIDAQLEGVPHLDLRVVADKSVWDVEELRALQGEGGVGAVLVRPAQAGGLLPAADLVREAASAGLRVCLSGMGDESRIAVSAAHQLALSVETVDAVAMAATVEHVLPLTEVSGETLSMETEMSEQRSSGKEDALFAEDPEEADFVDDDDEDIDQGEDEFEESLSGPRDLTVAHLEQSGVPGIGVNVSFISLVNDVEKMETFPEPPLPEFDGMVPNVFDDIEDLHPLGARGSKGHLAEREALALGLSTRRYSKGVFMASDGIHEPVNFKWNRNPLVSGVALGLCTHKEATRLQLQRAGVPVPQGRTFERGDLASARSFAERIGYPVVMKPAMGVRGIGVVANIQNEQELNDAHDLMTSTRLGDQDFIVEKHINGKDYRIVVVGDQVVAAILREPASVVGDAQHSVAELLLNRNSARRRNPHLWARPPQYNAAAKYELQKQGLTIDSVPEPGQTVRLGSTNSLSQGGESIAVLEEMHPSILEACLKVVRSVPGMDYCGVDFLLENHTKPLDEQDAGICELNAHAAIGNCQYPMFGTPRPVARIVMYEVARRFDLKVDPEPAEQVHLRVVVRGRVTGVGYRRWLRRRALEAGVDGWVRNLDTKRIEAVLSGPTNATTGLVSSLINGPRRARPTSYVADHISSPDVTGFDIRSTRSGLEQFRSKAGRKIRKIWGIASGR